MIAEEEHPCTCAENSRTTDKYCINCEKTEEVTKSDIEIISECDSCRRKVAICGGCPYVCRECTTLGWLCRMGGFFGPITLRNVITGENKNHEFN